MQIRKYQRGEERELWGLFFDAVRNVASRDYSAEQVAAWAPDAVDEEHWRSKIERLDPFVCLCQGRIVGYADVQPTGYIDHLFVAPRHQGRGVAKALFARIETEAKRLGIAALFANVSITARPFFESRGFCVVAEQQVAIGSVTFRNFRMVKPLAG